MTLAQPTETGNHSQQSPLDWFQPTSGGEKIFILTQFKQVKLHLPVHQHWEQSSSLLVRPSSSEIPPPTLDCMAS